jgi:carboxymethylenebutenolidase
MRLRLRGMVVVLSLLASPVLADDEKGRSAWWWDEGWWSRGTLEEVRNYEVETRQTSYKNGDVEVPALVARPKGNGKFPGVLFVHGRRGLDDWTRLHAIRLAARGFVVFAPDLYTGRFIEQFPITHDYAVEGDLEKGLDDLLKLPDLNGKRVCSVGVSRGGYYTLKLAVTRKRQVRDVACYVGYYPHMQDPNAPEPAQVYQFAPEVNDFGIPALIFIGSEEQYQRKRVIQSSVDTLKARGVPVHLVEYPGVGRGFDFRGGDVRTYADNLTAKDAMQRTAAFIHAHLAPRR